jgi:hypothetical protein
VSERENREFGFVKIENWKMDFRSLILRKSLMAIRWQLGVDDVVLVSFRIVIN